MRVVLLLALIVAWADPPLPAAAPGWLGGAVDVLLVRDRSGAARRDPPGHESALVRALAGLPEGSRAAAVDVGHGTIEVRLPAPAARLGQQRVAGADAAPGGELARAVDVALGLAVPGRATRLVLVSDGTQDAAGGDPRSAVLAALAQARQAAVPVIWLDLRGGPAPPAAWIESLSLPGHAPPGARVPVAVAVGSRGVPSATLRLDLDGAPLQEVRLALPTDGEQTLWFGAPAAGDHEVAVQLSVPGQAPADGDRRAALLRVTGPAGVLYLSPSPDPPLARSLAAGGWPVELAPPRMLAEGLRAGPALVVLDDVAAWELAPEAVADLARAVRRDAVGLLVLGGPASFGAGGYLGSPLEALLPVTAEPPAPHAPVAALFLVDTSGSMARGALAMARRAVAETASGLAPGDLSGVYGFDVTHRELLPLAPHPRPGEQALAALGNAATGGTRLAGALRGAVRALAGAPVARRILLVVTDGRLDPGEDLSDAASQARSAGIQVLVLVVGETAVAAPALDALARAGGGALLRVGEVAELPRIMRRELERRRAPPREGPVRPAQLAPAPGMEPVTDWPALHGFAPTRARDGARVYLAAPGGAPLLAAHDAGAGRVAVLPAGLAGWASQWLRWPRFGELAGGLAHWLSAPRGSDALRLRVRRDAGALHLVLDALAPHGEWRREGVDLTAVSPRGTVRAALALAAPGRFEASLPVPAPGRHVFTVRAGEQSMRHVHLQPPAAARGGPRRQVLEAAAQQGLVRRVTHVRQLPLAGAGSSRAWLLLLAAIGYPLLLAGESAGARLAMRAAARYRRATTSTTGVPGGGVVSGS